MSLSRKIVELFNQLGMEPATDLFAPETGAALANHPGAALVRARLQHRFPEASPDLLLLLCLQSLSVQRANNENQLVDAELVATLPGKLVSEVRPTSFVVKKMLASARSEVIAIGYEIKDEDVIVALHEASEHARVILVCDRGRGCGHALLAGWPAHTTPPIVYQDRLRDDAAPHASMHGKALLVDTAELLITSANLTYHGMRGNIEFGIRIRGVPAVEAGAIFQQLVRSELLERIRAEDPEMLALADQNDEVG